MSSFMFKVVKAFQGHEWEQDYCVITDADPTPGFGEDEWSNATNGQNDFTDAYTDPSNGAYQGGQSLVHAVLGFERSLHHVPVQFVRLFAWDGTKNPTSESTFFTTPLSFAGLRDNPSDGEGAIAPGNVSWMIGKQPLGFGKRAGRAYYRMALRDVDVKPSGKRLLDWASTTVQEEYNNRLSAILTNSLLENHFGVGVGVTDATLAIPHYFNSSFEAIQGDLNTATPIQALVSKYPDGRQVNKGRKRKPATP